MGDGLAEASGKQHAHVLMGPEGASDGDPQGVIGTAPWPPGGAGRKQPRAPQGPRDYWEMQSFPTAPQVRCC